MQSTNLRLKSLGSKLKQNDLSVELIRLWTRNNTSPEFIFRELYFNNNEQWVVSYVNIDGELSDSVVVNEESIIEYLVGSPSDQVREENFLLDNFMRNLYTLLEPKYFYSSLSVPFVNVVSQFLEREVNVTIGATPEGEQNLRLNNLTQQHRTSIPEAEFGRDPEELYKNKISANNHDKFYTE